MDRPNHTRPIAKVIAFRPRQGPLAPADFNRQIAAARTEVVVPFDHLNRSTRASGHAA